MQGPAPDAGQGASYQAGIARLDLGRGQQSCLIHAFPERRGGHCQVRSRDAAELLDCVKGGRGFEV